MRLAALAAAATVLAGHSVGGTAIKAVRTGPAQAERTVLVVGVIHGNEPAGRAVVRALRRMDPPAGLQVWTVASVNPDGERAGTRQNARGVDLNRNFPTRWRAAGSPWDVFYPGPSAASEPETRALQRLVYRLNPDVTIHYHQALNLVALPRRNADADIVRAYARRTGMRTARLPDYRGTASSWQNATHAGTTAFVVELAAGSLTPAQARRHARAALRAGEGPVTPPDGAAAAFGSAAARIAHGAAVPGSRRSWPTRARR
jgi:murein peptide amidase A